MGDREKSAGSQLIATIYHFKAVTFATIENWIVLRLAINHEYLSLKVWAPILLLTCLTCYDRGSQKFWWIKQDARYIVGGRIMGL